jgi:glycosyltransferase involved in cell wall biosynthesis
MSKKVKLSVVIITFNEERNIGRCLDSIGDLADDIVVIDSFSSDLTEKICIDKGARFIKHAFEGYIEQKNWAITQAKYPIILSLDADEALSPELKISISNALNNWQYDGYSMNRLTNYAGKWIHHSGWYPDTKLRLWDSSKGKWGGINPHDKYELHPGCTIQHLHGDLLHYSFYSIQEHEAQSIKFATIAANALYAKGKSATLVKIWLSVWFRFVKHYIIYKGFLDGKEGFTISKITAKYTGYKYRLLRTLNKERH